jgi:hypothetical protein
MAIKSPDQYKYSGKGPLDAKSLVKTYAELLSESTWTLDGKNVAYNGMITAVGLNKDDPSKNGIYFLHDATVTSAIKPPEVTNPANWHKLADLSELTALVTRLSAIETDFEARLTALEEDSDVITYGYRLGFPTVGESNKLYVAADEGKSYVWFNDEYLPVGGAAGSYEEPEIIYGGSAD